MIGTDAYHIVIQLNPDPKDYRYCDIDVTEINPSTLKMPAEPLKAKFLGKGVIRLFREFEDELHPFNNEVVNLGDETMVSIIGLPTYFTATDLLGFIGEAYINYITHIRILKSEKPNRFLVLIKFKDIVKTAEFQYNFNGKPFNSIEPETCHVIFVKSVRYDSDSDIKNDTLLPFLMTDPFISPSASGPSSPMFSSSFSASSTETLIELPTCPVCLERMDSTITGLLTIPCQHTFHCLCLSKWTDDTCPICRYSNNFSNLKVKRSMRRPLQLARLQLGSSSALLADTPETDEHCADCSADSNLWICLICGNVGCDRYAPEQHSLQHFINTGHCFAMEVETSRVWDYAGDNYVHRLVANEADGKIVELPEKTGADSLKTGSNGFDKVDEVGFEYSQLLISQLASQREYYESLLNERSAPKSRRGSVLPDTIAPSEIDKKVEELSKQVSLLTIDVIPSLKKKIKTKDEKITTLAHDLNSANMINDGLSSKVEFLTKENEEIKATNVDLQDQVKDLMFFLEGREKFKDLPQEVKDGTIVIQPRAKTSKLKKAKKK